MFSLMKFLDTIQQTWNQSLPCKMYARCMTKMFLAQHQLLFSYTLNTDSTFLPTTEPGIHFRTTFHTGMIHEKCVSRMWHSTKDMTQFSGRMSVEQVM